MISSSEFYVLGGTLPRDARSYAVRKADQDLFDGLCRGQFCYVLTSRQMGKSSLMVRTVARLRQENVTCLVIDLTSVGQNLTEDQWYDGLLSRIATQLDLEEELDAFWQENGRLGPLQRWMYALHSVVLAKVSDPIVLFVDEIDAVRSLPFSADEFFAAVRECYNRRTEDVEFVRLTFCLLGVATPADLIRDTRSTPFNIGRRIELTDFTEAEAAPLAEGLRECGGDTQARALLARVLYWTHGHPYLTQRLCHVVNATGAKSRFEVDRVCQQLFLSPAGQEQDDNLLLVRERLLRTAYDPAGLLTLYAKVREGKRVPNSETNSHITTLRLSGVVRVENGLLCVRNRIYAHVFDRTWIQTNLPGAEVRRQKMAYRRGSLSTALALAGVVSLFMGVFLLKHYQRHLNLHVPLKDGTELIVHDVRYSKGYYFEPGRFRWSEQKDFSYPHPELCVWISRYNPKTHVLEALDKTANIVVVDEYGSQYFSEGSRVAYSEAVEDKSDQTNHDISCYEFETFPRRSKMLHLQLYDPDGFLLKDFEVANPTPTLYPLWVPEPLPSTKQVGDLSVTLKSVKWLRENLGFRIGRVTLPRPGYIEPEWECRERGQLTKSWEMEHMEISDATGNVYNVGSFTAHLSYHEPAWKLHMTLKRRSDAAFTDAETWTLKGVKVPEDGYSVPLVGSGSIKGVTFQTIALTAAPSVTYYANYVPPKPSGILGPDWTGTKIDDSGEWSQDYSVTNGIQPQIAVYVSGLKDNQRLVVWATDEKGRRYSLHHQIYHSSDLINLCPGEKTRRYVNFLPIPQHTGQVDLHFSIQEPQMVEFVVRPPIPVKESRIVPHGSFEEDEFEDFLRRHRP